MSPDLKPDALLISNGTTRERGHNGGDNQLLDWSLHGHICRQRINGLRNHSKRTQVLLLENVPSCLLRVMHCLQQLLQHACVQNKLQEIQQWQRSVCLQVETHLVWRLFLSGTSRQG